MRGKREYARDDGSAAGGAGARCHRDPGDAAHQQLLPTEQDAPDKPAAGPGRACFQSTAARGLAGTLLLGRLGPPRRVDAAVCLCAERVTRTGHKRETERQKRAKAEWRLRSQGPRKAAARGSALGAPSEEERGSAHVRDRGPQSPSPGPPEPARSRRGERDGHEHCPSPGSGSQRPAEATADPKAGAGGAGRRGAAPPRTAPAAGVSLKSAAWTWAWGARGPGGNLKPARLRSLGGGGTRGSLLPTALRIHEGGKGTENPRDPPRSHSRKVVGPQGWERRGRRGVANSCPRSERWRGGTRPAGGLLPDPEGQRRGRAGVRSREGRFPTAPQPGSFLALISPGAIRPDRTLPAGGDPLQPLACIEPLPQDRPQGHPETPHRWTLADFPLPQLPARPQGLSRFRPNAASSWQPSRLQRL